MKKFIASIATAAVALSSAPVFAQQATSSNANTNSNSAVSTGSAQNSQANNSNSSSASQGGDLNNTVINPNAGALSTNRIGAKEVQCQGSNFNIGLQAFPDTNDNYFDNGGNDALQNLGFYAGFTMPLGGGVNTCIAMARKIEVQKDLEIQVNRVAAAASFVKTCLELQKANVDLDELDTNVFPVQFKNFCATVKPKTVAATPVPDTFAPTPVKPIPLIPPRFNRTPIR